MAGPAPDDPPGYRPRRLAQSRFFGVRGMRMHALAWGEDRSAEQRHPPLVMLHGWMDVAASFQFVVDAFAADRHVVALDWRGFGLSDSPQAGTYFFHEYLGDLEVVLDTIVGTGAPVDLLGHSMGGNVAMLYAGVRPGRVRRLINLEGFGMPRTAPADAPQKIARWLDSLREDERLKPYDSLDAVAARLRKTNPLLRGDRALWLAAQWSAPVAGADGSRLLLADPNHKRPSPQQASVDEWLACWQRITAPLLWIEGDRTDVSIWWGTRYSKAEFHERLDCVPGRVDRRVVAPAGHLLHHDQPEAVARLVETFLSESLPS